MSKKFYIKTLGCKVNQYESQVIREGFLSDGYLEAGGIDEADVCVVNTCTVTSVSDSKSLRLIRKALENSKCVVATGCLVEDKSLDLSRLSGVRFIIKNKDKSRIPQIVNSSNDKECSRSQGITGLEGHTRVFVKIQDGCDNVCSYCKVRVVRGRSRSRTPGEVIKECSGLIESDYREMVLTGICIGAYGKDLARGLNLAGLIKEVCKIKGDWRLRLSSIEPKDISGDLLLEIKTEKRLCKHIHIPFQSGDDYILKRMDRAYKSKDYLDVVRRLKEAVPDIAITTDIMVGFPGETEKRFQNTVDFIKSIRPMRMHIFPFSRRRGTKAYNYKDTVTSSVKRKREKILSSLAAQLSQEFVDRFLGKERRVLVESKRSKDGYLQGYTDDYIKVYIEGPDSLKGKLINPSLALTNSKVHGILLP
ncbi:MAG: tRNA (N(6)-L-threonylcarbamoyladenosine(37)-C(2))-methylthiotransferase MtaB [Candidatus Omnitrophica bacterium]|nr:tRNA (N(6)-L-threonylcarbamoyladenosine(37)-C(2))-methylthiotransferase MtaB [Candidatus Omnitrophota bacterium]